MPVNQFKLLLGCFHLNDNLTVKPRDDPAYNKLPKVRPLLTIVRDNFLCEYVPSRELSVDEAMVGFMGQTSIKQYMPMESIKHGL